MKYRNNKFWKKRIILLNFTVYSYTICKPNQSSMPGMLITHGKSSNSLKNTLIAFVRFSINSCSK